MSDQFDWDILNEEYGETPSDPGDPPQHKRNWGIWVFLTILLLFAIGSWGVSQYQLRQREAELKAEVQTVLDFERDAFQAGDGELFFSVQADDAAWLAAQLQPTNQAIYREASQVSKAEAHNEEVWANIIWEENGASLQRLTFFRWQNGLIHVPDSATYWGGNWRRDTDWGQLYFPEVDQLWASEVDQFVRKRVAELCDDACREEKLPLTLALTPNFTQTAVPNRLHIPSPRLIALDENGRPADIFWQQLEQQLEAYFTPAVLRFAIPPSRRNDGQTVRLYERAATQFMAEHPDIVVEIVALETMPEDPAQLALAYDGVLFTPTEEMITAGLIYDLTDYSRTDPDFDGSDFYEQIWQGAEWNDRLWMMPLAARMPVLYYDRTAYQQAGMRQPSLRWTWAEMERDIAQIVNEQPEASSLSWGFLDAGLDSLFSYAYNWGNNCSEPASVLCQRPLQPQNIAASLDWYNERTSQTTQMPNLATDAEELLGADSFATLSNINGDEREFVLLNFQTSQRVAAIWVDLPVNFEHQYLLATLGVLPFPGSDKFDGISPLRVQGAFISQQSKRPYATWQWLKFLSYQKPSPRLIPARPSVAEENGYWQFLPRDLGNAMRAAFPFARPITIEDQNRLTWEQVTAVVSGELTAAEAARQPPKIIWFAEQ